MGPLVTLLASAGMGMLVKTKTNKFKAQPDDFSRVLQVWAISGDLGGTSENANDWNDSEFPVNVCIWVRKIIF